MNDGLDRVAKVCGADVELGNFILGARSEGTAGMASRAVLREIAGLPAWRAETSYPVGDAWLSTESSQNHSSSQDWGRKYLPTNGGCAYIDLDHLELCTPEVLSAFDHVAAWYAMLRTARRALDAANAKLPAGQKIQLLVNNSDGRSHSYGSHLSFLLTRRAWDNLFERRIHHLLFLAAYQVSSIIFTGQGKVGAENGAPDVPFQIAQRADFFETLVGTQTTYRRPIVNARDEALCGEARSWQAPVGSLPKVARLHSIFFDSTLCQVATLLKVGVMQIVLAQIEVERVDPSFILEAPLEALRAWSHDPTLRRRARMADGRELTAVELQLGFLERAQRFVEEGGCEGIVPRAQEILALWADTLEKLRAGDFALLARRIDWILKLTLLRRAMERRPCLDFASPSVKMLDHLYGSLSEDEGLFWPHAVSGTVDSVVTPDEIARLEIDPPEDTRAWARAMLLRIAGSEGVDDVDWDWVKIWPPGRRLGWTGERIDLPDPLGSTRAALGQVFAGVPSLEDVIDALRPAPRSEERRLVVVASTTVH